jgi:hypothetical protein
MVAKKHRPAHASTEAHKKFLQNHLSLANHLQEKNPYIDFKERID